MNTINRLQLRHHTPIFETREAAIEYIYSQIRFADEGLAFEDKSYGFSLLGEPTVLLYKNVTEADPTGENDPHLIFAIGSATNEGTQYNDNRFCIIDIDKTEKEIEDLWEELEKAIKSLSIFTRDTNTLKLYSEKTEDGTIISGDVVVATSQIFDDARKPNIILSTDDGLFTYVNMEYDKDNDLLTFTVNGETKQWLINNNYLVGGWYSKKDESLHLKSKDDSEIVISLENLIDEWGVEGEASNTPIVLTREEVGYGDDSLHNHVEPWQDVLKADVRLADRRYNILKKTSDGRYLYVDGLANNITFFKDGEEMTVQEALANATKGASNDSTNIIYEKADGFYATAMLKYLNKENKLVFTTSNVTGGTTTEEIKLNSVEAFKKIVYDPVTETLIIMYVDGNGDIQECDVPIGQMMQDWEWDIVNDGHNVKLHKQRVVGGNDKVSADAAIYDDPDNILVDKNHELFVKGTADNIRYGRDGNVSDELDKLNANDADINARLNETSGKVDTLRVEFDAEVERATSEEQRIEDKLNNEITRSKEKDAEHDSKISTIEQTIGDGFSIDGHETITYKFNELSAKTNTISAKTETIDANLGLLSAKTEAEIVRAKSEEQRIEKKFDDALGEGFDIRNTVRDEFDREKSERVGEDARLQAEIDALSADTKGKLIDVINLDHSIDVDKTDPVKPVISVNLSDEQIENMPNVIKLNNDGLYAGVDLDYYFESGTSKNVLVFKTTNGTKTFDLKTNSVVDKIYYDPTREAIIIEYTVDGHRMPDVVVLVHDLINEWCVSEDTNGAIKLYKYRESGATQDVLYAESIISDHEDNILINDNGALYVSGAQIEQNKADIAALGERMDAAEADIDALEDGLAAEIARATGEEQRIEEKLDREIERSTTEDDNLWEALRAEIARSTDKDNEHDREIAEEIQRAKDAEHALHDEIVEETTARISGDTALNTKIDNEIARSTAKDEEHDTKINELRTDLTNEITNRTNEDLRLEGLIHAEEDRAKTAESAITHALEVAVLGHKVDQECGSGFTYTPKETACFISAATDMYDADIILDKYVCSAHTRITKVEEDVDCLWQEVNITQENVLGFVIPPCGINADGTPYHYTGHIDACIISAATSMDDADVLLDEAICGMMGDFNCISAETKMVEDVLGVVGNCDKVINYPASQGCLLSSATTFAQADLILEEAVCALMGMAMRGSERPTTSAQVVQDPLYPDDPDKKMIAVDVRLSHGNDSGRWQEDEDLVITDYNGDCIESGDSACAYSEFTDTNVLRIVDLTGLGFVPEAKYNGLFLSNVWDCGQYTENGEGTPYEKYMIDDSATAENYYDRVYRNGKRYHNG